jgi:hypothetical protein
MDLKLSKTYDLDRMNDEKLQTLTLQKISIVGWAMPTKYHQSRLLTVGNAAPYTGHFRII